MDPGLPLRLLTALGVALLPGVMACGGGSGSTTSSSNTPSGSQEACLGRASFGDPADSPYVLPYEVGEAFTVTQSYCNPRGGHRDTFAYDFDLPIGAAVRAARAGEVIVANDQYADDDHIEGHENNVFVLHDDGSVVRYTHLRQGSIVVALGTRVEAGQILGQGGASGNTGGVPHLHFEVFASRGNYNKANALPVNFRNARGELDGRGGLAAGTLYVATASNGGTMAQTDNVG